VVNFDVLGNDMSLERFRSYAETENHNLSNAFRLDKDINLIGRSSELKGIHPEIALGNLRL
jgi:hypothetical protein